MARTTITQITDDLDGSKDAEEVSFSFRGADYVIDLSKKNQAAMEKALRPYLDAATQTSRKVSTKGSGSRASKSAAKSRGTTRRDLSAVREWAQANGIRVSERGRIAREVLEQYDAASKQP